MGNVVLLLVVALTVGAVVFGVMTLITGGDPGLRAVDADDRAQPLPGDRPLAEEDVTTVTFDLAWRGYRMAQVDQTLRRLAYDTGYKSELIQVLEAEIIALREGRLEDADVLAKARAAALVQAGPQLAAPVVEGPDDGVQLTVASTEPFVEAAVTEPAAEVEPDPETDVATDVEVAAPSDPADNVPTATGRR